jgi:hypothetical protein
VNRAHNRHGSTITKRFHEIPRSGTKLQVTRVVDLAPSRFRRLVPSRGCARVRPTAPIRQELSIGQFGWLQMATFFVAGAVSSHSASWPEASGRVPDGVDLPSSSSIICLALAFSPPIPSPRCSRIRPVSLVSSTGPGAVVVLFQRCPRDLFRSPRLESRLVSSRRVMTLITGISSGRLRHAQNGRPRMTGLSSVVPHPARDPPFCLPGSAAFGNQDWPDAHLLSSQ